MRPVRLMNEPLHVAKRPLGWTIFRLGVLTVALAPLLASAAPRPGEDAAAAAVQRARELFGWLSEGKYSEVSAAGTPQVRKALTVEALEQIWKGFTGPLGTFRTIETAEPTIAGAAVSVRITAAFERGKLVSRVVVNEAGQLAGLWFDDVQPAAKPPPPYADPARFREEAVTVDAGQFPLDGKLCVPVEPGRYPAVVLVHGSGPHDMDEIVGAQAPFRDLAWGLASRGVAVLRYVKRTKAHPTAYAPRDWTLERETIDDALAAILLLRQREEVDARRVFLAGHSLGGFAAPYIARSDSRLAGLILLAANSRSVLDLIDEQVEYLAGLDGTNSDAARKQVEDIRAATAAIRAGRAEDVKTPLMGAPASYWADLHQRDAVAIAARLTLPMLIVQGGKDYQVTRADFDGWRKALGERKNVRFEWLDDLHHLLAVSPGRYGPADYSEPQHVDARVVELLARWILSTPAAAENGR